MRDYCSRCNQMIIEKSIAYRDEKHDLVCVDCYEINITRKKVTRKSLNDKKEPITAPISYDDTIDVVKMFSKTSKNSNIKQRVSNSKKINKTKSSSSVNQYENNSNKKSKINDVTEKSKYSSQSDLKSNTIHKNSIKQEFTDSDIYKIKDKIKKQDFVQIDDLTNTLSAYSISNNQNKRDLIIQKSLESKIQILDHQIMCAKKVKNELNGRVILADEVGLGKTIEAGILLKEYFTTGLIKNALILTPPSLRTQWQDELKSKFDLDFIVNKDDERFEGFDKHQMQIVSLASASQTKNAELLKNIEWDIVIVDEAHRLKNSKTKAHIFVKELNKKFVFLLSATPIQNSILELYNMIEIVKPGFLGTWSSFSAKFTVDKKARVINSNLRLELQNLLQQVVVRTTRSEVRKYLKFTERIPKTHVMKPSGEESLLYENATNFVRELWEIEKGRKNLMLPLMTMQRQISSSIESTKAALMKKASQFPESVTEINKILALCDEIKQDTKIKELKKNYR